MAAAAPLRYLPLKVRLARRDELGMHFDRVIVDTAPTGHTLRLLTYPDFLDRFIERCALTPHAPRTGPQP